MFHVKHSFPLGAPTRSDRTDTPAGLRGSRRLGAARFGYADRIGALPKRTCAPRIPASPGMRPRADDPSARMHPAGARSPYACARLAGAPSARTYPAGARSARLRPGRPPRRAFAPPRRRALPSVLRGAAFRRCAFVTTVMPPAGTCSPRWRFPQVRSPSRHRVRALSRGPRIRALLARATSAGRTCPPQRAKRNLDCVQECFT